MRGGQRPQPDLRAEQLVQRAGAQTGAIERSEQFGITRGIYREPRIWVSERETHWTEIDREDDELNARARTTGNFVEFPELQRLETAASEAFKGNEHNVLLFPRPGGKSFVIRSTKEDRFGLAFRSPGEYPDRWALFNRAFPQLSVSFVAYTRNARGNGVILTAQRYVEGLRKTQAAIATAMGKMRFVPVNVRMGNYRNDRTGVEIYDAMPDNIRFDRAGNIQPFDIRINDPNDFFGAPGGGESSP